MPPTGNPEENLDPLPWETTTAGCTVSVIGGVEYHQCAGVYYRAAFQGNNLVYVATQP